MNSTECERLQEYIFTTTPPNELRHRCVVVFNEYYAVTYKHGGHSSLTQGLEVTLYPVKSGCLQIKATVHHVDDTSDFVIFKSAGFPTYPPVIYPYCGVNYIQLGVNEKREFVKKSGMLSTYDAEGGYFVGTSNAVFGDSGSGIFSEFGCFIGLALAVAKKSFEFRNAGSLIANFNILEVADHCSEPFIIPMQLILRHCPGTNRSMFLHDPDE